MQQGVEKPDLWSFLQLGFSAPAPLFPNQSLPRAHFELKVGGPHFPAAFHAPTDPSKPSSSSSASSGPLHSHFVHQQVISRSPLLYPSAHPFPSPRLALKGIVSLSFHCVAHNDVIARKIQRYFTPHRRIRGEIRELIIAHSL